jgi:hypothetical protein
MVVVLRRLRKGGDGERFLSAFEMTKREDEMTKNEG